MCGTTGIPMKHVRYNGNPHRTTPAGQSKHTIRGSIVRPENREKHTIFGASHRTTPAGQIKTYNQRRYRPARKSGKKHKKTYNSPPRRPAASRTKRTMHGAIVRPENPKKNIQSNWSCLIGRLVGCWLLLVVDNPRRGSPRGQKCEVQLKS